MALELSNYKDIAEILKSLATVISIIIGGIWVYMKFIRQQEKYPNINFTADINLIGTQDGVWIVELIATIENKGKAQHRMAEFNFDLYSLINGEAVTTSDHWGGQIDFKHLVTQGSFLPKSFDFFFVDPGTSAKYSYIAKVPSNVTFLILHAKFMYSGRRKYGHTAEKTIMLPKEDVIDNSIKIK